MKVAFNKIARIFLPQIAIFSSAEIQTQEARQTREKRGGKLPLYFIHAQF
jgi:hypothetical protein